MVERPLIALGEEAVAIALAPEVFVEGCCWCVHRLLEGGLEGVHLRG